MKKIVLHYTCPFLVMILLGFDSGSVFAQNAQFEYDLKITADPAKRAAYLK